ncbi:MAG TPA: oligosaccharide flippase family protein [Thermoanaerobaculia bacterium]|nr:oligosaccharide flippase family protein [Thermoanaerobaculia bacterium]
MRLSNLTLTSTTKAYWILGAMVTTILTARFLGPQGRGIIAAATSSVAMFVTFGHLSLSQVLVYVAGRGERERVLPVITGSLLAITAATTLVAWAICAALYIVTEGRAFQHIAPPLLVLAFASLPFLLWLENGNSLLIVLGDLKRLNVAQLAGTTTAILLVTLAVGVLKGGVAAALTATLVSSIIVVALGLARVLRDARPLAISQHTIRELLGGGMRLHLAAIGTFFFTHAGVLMLNQFRPVAEAGYFQLAMQLTTAMQVVPMAVAVVAYSLVARDGADAAWPEHRRLVLQTMLYASVAAIGSYFVAPVIVPLLAGHNFAPAVPLFRILTLSVFGMSLATVMAPQWIARGFFLRAAALSLVAALVGVTGNVLLIPRYGMRACAWVMVASYGVHLVNNAAFAWWIERREAR